MYSHGGRKNTGLDAVQWAAEMARRGAGEILLTSMDRDGTKSGFDLALTRAVSDAVSVPVIASGGVGNLDHLADGIQQGGADAVLAASIFHYGEYTVGAGQGADGRARHPGAPVSAARGSPTIAAMNWLDEVKWDAHGLVPVIAQEQGTRRRADVRLDEPRGAAHDGRARPRRVLQPLAQASCGSRARSPATCRRCTRSAWIATTTCVLLKVTQHRPRARRIACHTGRHSCFFQRYEDGALDRRSSRS